jgi:hypothetical protein
MLGGNMPRCHFVQPQIPHGLTHNRTRVCVLMNSRCLVWDSKQISSSMYQLGWSVNQCHKTYEYMDCVGLEPKSSRQEATCLFTIWTNPVKIRIFWEPILWTGFKTLAVSSEGWNQVSTRRILATQLGIGRVIRSDLCDPRRKKTRSICETSAAAPGRVGRWCTVT